MAKDRSCIDLKQLDRVSIVIPSINHPMLLERSIEYWRKIHVRVHILDGSKRPLFDNEDFKDLRISYHHQPWGDEDNYSNFCNLMSQGTKLVSTEFAAICGDDDFFTVSGLLKSINSLSSDLNVDAITGRTAYYLEGSSKIRWSVKGLSRIDSPKMRSEEINERMYSGSPWAMYAICRTKLWKELFDISFSERLEHKDAHELLVRELSRVMMRSKVINDLVSVRQFTIPGSNLPEAVSLSDWLKSELTLNSCATIRSRLSRGVDSALVANKFVNSSEIVDSIISQYLPTAKKEHAVAVKSSRPLTATFKKLFNKLPHFIKILFFLAMKPQVSIQGSRHGFWLFCILLKRANIPFIRKEMAIINKIVSCPESNVSIRAQFYRIN